jgi:hypothetical protein
LNISLKSLICTLIIVPVLLICFPDWAVAQFGQENFRAGFHSRFGEGEKVESGPGDVREDKAFLENSLELEYSYGLWQAGATLESREPAEYGRNFTKMLKGYVQYTEKNYLLRVGTLYGLSGQGLSINLVEDRSKLNFDNSIRGVQGSVTLNRLIVSTMAGVTNYTDYDSPLVRDRHYLGSLSLEYLLSHGFRVGVVALQDRLVHRTDQASTGHIEIDADIPSLVWGPWFGYSRGNWEFNAEFSRKLTGRNRLGVPDVYQIPIRMLDIKQGSSGNGLYWNLGFAEAGYGITLEYKNYQYNMTPSTLLAHGSGLDPTSALPFQLPPTTVKEHLYTLLNRFPVMPHLNNEIGMQLELNAKPSRAFQLQLVLSGVAQADVFGGIRDGRKVDRERSGFVIWPHFNLSHSPVYDTFLDIHYRHGRKIQLHGGVGHRKLIDYSYRNGYSHRTDVTTVPLKAQIRWSRRFTTLFDLETQHVSEKFLPIGPPDKDYFNHYLEVTFSFAPKFSIAISREFTDQQSISDKNWDLITAAMRLGSWGNLLLSYGEQREGVLCSNGFCRQVPGYEGLRGELSLFF